jgi:succinyl-CoA synthetase beta subunit
MVPAGLKLVAGVRIDPGFGPLILVGLGGVLVELLRDSVVGIAPVNVDEATRMLHKLRGAALLDGFRGGARVNVARLADIIARLSEFAADQQRNVLEVDINPIICAGDEMTAVDALIVRRPR